MSEGIGGAGLGGQSAGASLLPELARAEGLFGLLADPATYAARLSELRAEVLRCEAAQRALGVAGDASVALREAESARAAARKALEDARKAAEAILAEANTKRTAAERAHDARVSDLDLAAQEIEARDSELRVREVALDKARAKFEREREAHASDHSACETFFAARRDAAHALDAAVRTFLKQA